MSRRRSDSDSELIGPDSTSTTSVEESDSDADLPVVARLMVEIRSDGSRTVARGAMEDVATGERVAVEARGASPLSLAMGLAKSMFRAPALARSVTRALLPGRKKKRRWGR